MKNRKTTRRALFASVISMILCCAMLVGTTFAWFTDTESGGINQIHSGNLDVALYHVDYLNGDYSNPEKVVGNTELFRNVDGEEILWEPGAGAAEDFIIKNEGTLALKYQFNVIFDNATETPAGKTLADIMDVTMYQIGGNFTDKQFQEDENGNIIVDSVVINGENNSLENCVLEGYLLPGEDIRFLTVLNWYPSDNDNDYNVAGGLSIDLGINLVATQYTYEKDATGDQYDVEAEYPVIHAVSNATDFEEAVKNAQPGEMINLNSNAEGTLKLSSELNGVTIMADKGNKALLDITDSAVLEDVTFKNFDLSGYNGSGSYNGAININAGAEVDLTFENCSFAPNTGYSGVRVQEPTAELSFINCQFTGGRYAVYDSGAPIAKAEFIGCSFVGQSSWAVQFNGSGTASNITFDNCTFDSGNGGIIKVLGAPAEGSTFTFTNNTITNSRGHDGKDSEWFSISNVFAIKCENNTLDGAAWNPAAAQGLGR